MKKTTLFAVPALALAILQAEAHAAEHRLAFSKAHNVEVFATEHDGQWCQRELTLRFVFGNDNSDLAAVESLLPKLGVLFAQQCPAATAANWQALNKHSTIEASGQASKEGAWLMQQTPASTPVLIATAPAPVAAETSPVADRATEPQAEVVPTTVNGADQAPTNTPETVASVPTAQAPGAPTDNAISPATSASEKAIAAPVAEKATKQQNEAIAAATSATEPPGKADRVETAPSATAITEPAAPAEQPAAPVVNDNFAVNGWQPKNLNELIKNHPALLTVLDQNKCAAFLSAKTNLGNQGYAVRSTDLDCINGYLQGSGQLEILRPDGAHLVNLKEFFVSGFPIQYFPKEHLAALPVAEVNEQGNLLFLLQKDNAYQQYFLMSARLGWQGRWVFEKSNVYALTERADDYRTAQAIKNAVLAPVAAYTKLYPDSSHYTYTALNTPYGADEHKYYTVGVYHDSRKKVWSFDPNRATNYLYKNEARAAEQAKREAERLAYEERLARERKEHEEKMERQQAMRQAANELKEYNRIRNDKRPLSELIRNSSDNIIYDKAGSSQLARLLQGGIANFAGVVYINRQKNNTSWATYPYTLAIKQDSTTNDMDKGWYFIRGTQQFDTTQTDEQDMPLTIVTANEVLRCERKACEDLFTPINRIRIQYKKPDWTPEAAQQLIDAAEQGVQP